MEFDCIVIGCGLSGSVIARCVAEKINKRVLIIERRNHIGGNMFDYLDENGILIHKYGPHLFHTNNAELVSYLERFTEWREYKVRCMAYIDGKYTPSPFNFQTIDDFYALEEDAQDLKKRLLNSYGSHKSASILELLYDNDQIIRRFAELLFEKDYRPYAAKQWGIPAMEIAPSTLARVPIRFSYNADRFEDHYQLLPKSKYTDFFDAILNHPNITLRMGENALDSISADIAEHQMCWNGKRISIPIVFTGALDELFDFQHGSLPYRSLRFEKKTIPSNSFQPAPIVVYPQAPDFIRISEYKKLSTSVPEDITTIVIEYPAPYSVLGKNEPYYVIHSESSKRAVAKYNAEASQIPNLFLCGRLAEYKYYNMDEVLVSALRMGNTLEQYYQNSQHC